jgi:hypothetical protein
MTTFIIISLYLIWILFAITTANFEAKYWALRNKTSNVFKFKDEHNILTIMRVCLAIPISLIFFYYFSWWAFAGSLSLVTIFPFFHDGFYYYFRNKIDGSYQLGFKDTSTTSTARTDTIDYPLRLAMLLVHTSILILLMIFGSAL